MGMMMIGLILALLCGVRAELTTGDCYPGDMIRVGRKAKSLVRKHPLHGKILRVMRVYAEDCEENGNTINEGSLKVRYLTDDPSEGPKEDIIDSEAFNTTEIIKTAEFDPKVFRQYAPVTFHKGDVETFGSIERVNKDTLVVKDMKGTDHIVKKENARVEFQHRPCTLVRFTARAEYYDFTKLTTVKTRCFQTLFG